VSGGGGDVAAAGSAAAAESVMSGPSGGCGVLVTVWACRLEHLGWWSLN
jgi:hypothetical protein